MFLLLFFILAIIMATFGIVGSKRGTLVMLIALAPLAGAFVATELWPDKVVSLLNTLYRLSMSMLKGGLGAFVSGDLEAFFKIFETVEAPFKDGSQDLALLVVLGSAFVIGLLAMLFMKARSSVGGAVVGVVYGYLASAAFLPLLLGFRAGLLPVPPFRAVDPSAVTVPAPTLGGPDAFFRSLSQSGAVALISLTIMVGMALILIFSARGKKKGG